MQSTHHSPHHPEVRPCPPLGLYLKNHYENSRRFSLQIGTLHFDPPAEFWLKIGSDQIVASADFLKRL